MDDPWTELGIAPTADKTVIRRAYAARLKAIGADRDAGAFMRLREAYDQALEAAQFVDFADEDETPIVDGPSKLETARWPADHQTATGDRPMPQPSGSAPAIAPLAEAGEPGGIDVPFGSFEAFVAEFQSLLAARDSRNAWRLLNAVLAKGIVPLGREYGHVRSLMTCVLADPALSPDELDGFVRAFIATANRDSASSKILEDMKARARALRWWNGIEDATRSGAGWGSWRRIFSRSIRVATVVRKGRARGLLPGDIDAFSRQVARLREHDSWLAGRIDLERLDRDLQRVKRNDRWRTAAFIALIVSPFIIVRLPIGEDNAGAIGIMTFCAGGFGLALLTDWERRNTLGGRAFRLVRWVLGLVCLAILVLVSWFVFPFLIGARH